MSAARPGSVPALTITAGAVAVVIVFFHSVGFSTFASDPLNYWADSLYWREPFNAFHVAGFPLLIALLRGVTFDALSPVTVMTTVSGLALLTGVHGSYRLASTVGLSHRVSIAAATAFGIWPFVGTVYAAFPVADPLVLTLMVWAAVYAVRANAVPTGVLLGLAAVAHKSLWPAIAWIVIGSFLWTGRTRRSAITVAVLASIPITALWIAGVIDGRPASWLASNSANDGVAPLARHSLPVFDGLAGSVIYGGWIARARVVVVVLVVALALVVFVSHYRHWREPFSYISAAFALQVLGAALVMNQHLVWSSVRFSGLLAVPTAALVARRIDSLPAPRWHLIAAAVVTLLVSTQLLTAWEGSHRGWLGIL